MGEKNNEAREHGLSSRMEGRTAGLDGVAAGCSAAACESRPCAQLPARPGRQEVSSIRSGYATLLRLSISALEGSGS